MNFGEKLIQSSVSNIFNRTLYLMIAKYFLSFNDS